MAKKLSVQMPGLVLEATKAKVALARLYDRLADTAGSHSTVSSDLATARADVDTLLTAIQALS